MPGVEVEFNAVDNVTARRPTRPPTLGSAWIGVGGFSVGLDQRWARLVPGLVTVFGRLSYLGM